MVRTNLRNAPHARSSRAARSSGLYVPLGIHVKLYLRARLGKEQQIPKTGSEIWRKKIILLGLCHQGNFFKS